jgi:hypothetical protein
MRSLICAALLCAAPSFAGDLVARDKDAQAELRLMESKCSHGGTLAQLKEEYRDQFKNARLIVGKTFIYACWIEKDGTAIVLLEDGTFMPVPMSAFSDPTI